METKTPYLVIYELKWNKTERLKISQTPLIRPAKKKDPPVCMDQCNEIQRRSRKI